MRLVPLASLAVLVASSLSCKDATGPGSNKPSLEVSVKSITPGTPVVNAPDGSPKISCSWTLEASAAGMGSAIWGDAMMRFYLGADRGVAADSQAFDASMVQYYWGDRITPGTHPQSVWSAWAGAPFEVEIEFQLIGEADTRVSPVKIRMPCGPPPGTSGAAPSVSQFTVSPDTGGLQIGSTIHVTYAAGSPNGLWSTAVQVSGPFTFQREFAENGATSQARTVDVVVPAGAQLGVPLAVSVAAVDPGLRSATRTMTTSAVVIDTTPPVLTSVSFNALFPGQAGQFAVGDRLAIQVTASDNNALAWLVWEVGSPAIARDSLKLGTNQPTSNDPVVQPEWVGQQVVSVYVRDVAGLKSATVSAQPGQVSFYPLVTHPTSAPAVVAGGSDVMDQVYDAKRGALYMSMPDAHRVAKIDVATMTVAGSVAFASTVGGLDLTPSGDSLIVALGQARTLAVLNPDQLTDTLGMIPLSVLDTAGSIAPSWTPEPTWVRVGANGVAVTSLSWRTKGGDDIVTTDLATGAQRIRADARTSSPYPMQVMGPSLDRSFIVMIGADCSRLYQSSSDSFAPCDGGGGLAGNFRAFSIDAAGDRFAAGNAAYDLSFHQLRANGAINGQFPIAAISADGTLLYLGALQTVSVMRIADGKMLERFNLPIRADRMLMSPTGDWLAVIQNGGAVVRVDLNQVR